MTERTCVALKKNNFLIDYICGKPSKGGRVVRRSEAQTNPFTHLQMIKPKTFKTNSEFFVSVDSQSPDPNRQHPKVISPRVAPASVVIAPHMPQEGVKIPVVATSAHIKQKEMDKEEKEKEEQEEQEQENEETVLKQERDRLIKLLKKASEANGRNKQVFDRVVADRNKLREDQEICASRLDQCKSLIRDHDMLCVQETDHLASRIAVLEGKLAECQRNRQKCENDKAKCEESKALCEAEQMFIDDFIESIQIPPQEHPLTVPGIAGVPTPITRMRIPTFQEVTENFPPLVDLLVGYRPVTLDDIERTIMRLEHIWNEQ